ncbi:Bleomycin hydrolase [Fructilactobacillus fructivorans]|nr:Bleomycin hydrolase [Fructilactobacillus fructivorans]KRN40925.1 Bleomycin hydrolase [Fructilactobacillus fructivorans]KRN42606.1 Bleomycin hydrolase [Fructilactobacillus fructivorans]
MIILDKKAISPQDLEWYEKSYEDKDDSLVLERAVSHNGINNSAADYKADEKMKRVFSVEVPEQHVADQKQSGRCWMFSALNTMRFKIAENYKISPKFELSQNYVNFWDKFEKSNYFLENVIKTADQPLGSRKIDFLMETPQQDGGQWDMLCAIIEKYGVVPSSTMVETYNSNRSDELNQTLNLKLRRDAEVLRKMVKDGSAEEKLESTKSDMLNDVYRILAYSLGRPTKRFDFEYRDTDNKYHMDKDLTPKEFFDKYVNINLEDYVSLINSPTDDKPFNETYTIEMLGNVVGGRQVKHLNLPIDELKDLAIKQLKNGEAVWFGCDVVQDSDRKKGIMDTHLYHKDALFSTDLKMSKGARLDYKESMMTHAMVITGVDLVDDQPTKWKVENSWGEKVGDKGYFVMSDDWFNEFVYQTVINKKYMSDKQLEEQKQAPKMLEPWDPMGSLASFKK